MKCSFLILASMGVVWYTVTDASEEVTSSHDGGSKSPVTPLTIQLRGARTRRFITVFTRARHRSLSWTNWIHTTSPQPISLRSVLISSSHQRFGLPSGLSPSGFAIKTLYTFLPSSMRATCPAHLILLGYLSEYTALFPRRQSSSFNTVCVTVWIGPCPEPDKYTPHPPTNISLKSTAVLPSYLSYISVQDFRVIPRDVVPA
jgi:hypothetical protein